MQGVRLVAVSDADETRMNNIRVGGGGRGFGFGGRRGQPEQPEQPQQELKRYQDFRELLDDKEIDAVSSAPPNHWHALITIMACQAGKDIYIEKPACHEIWEGRKMVEAARKYNRIVQIGTQRRSSGSYKSGYEWIKEGNIGQVKWSRGFCYKDRGPGSNGIVNATNGPNPLPETLDYNLWCGPAEMEPLRRRELHYKWHWVWNTGNGDIGNQGVHEMDEARWALGDPGLPEHVFCIAGRFGVNDTGQTANTQIVYFDYKPAPLIFEVQGLPRVKGTRGLNHYRGIRVGVVIQCEDGYFAGGEGGGSCYDNEGEKIKDFGGDGGGSHFANFITAVKSRKVEDLNADVEVGHLSASLCHMANISYRTGKYASVEEIKNTIGDNAEFMDSFDRMVEHLKANEIDFEKEPITMGPMLTMDPKTERFTGENSKWANMYIKRNYREPFVVPDEV
jgi:predicted dehydrogenase